MSRTVTVEIDSVTVDADIVDNIAISYGRRRIDETCIPSQCTVTALTDMGSFDYVVGLELAVTATIGSTPYPRFIGRIAQVRVGRYTTEIIAVSSGLGAVAHVPREELTIPADSTFLSGTWVSVLYSGLYDTPNFDPGTTIPNPSTVIGPGNALDLMNTVAGWDTRGLVWEEQDGTVHFEDGNSRASISPAASTITADQVLDDWTAEQTVDSIVNQATVTYSTGQVTVQDTDSISTYGEWGRSIDVPIADDGDAYSIASRQLVGATIPTFATNPVTVLLKTMSDAEVEDLLVCTVSSILDLSAVAAVVPGVPADCFLEGYDETIRNRCDDWQLSLYVSDVALTRKPQSWNEVTASLAWSGVSGTLTWLQALGTTL